MSPEIVNIKIVCDTSLVLTSENVIYKLKLSKDDIIKAFDFGDYWLIETSFHGTQFGYVLNSEFGILTNEGINKNEHTILHIKDPRFTEEDDKKKPITFADNIRREIDNEISVELFKKYL